MMTRTVSMAAALLALAATSAGQTSPAKTELTIGVSNVVRVGQGQLMTTKLTAASAPGVDKMTLEDLTKFAGTLKIVDHGPLRGSAGATAVEVEFGVPVFAGREGQTGISWQIPLRKVPGLAEGTSQTRQAVITLGEAGQSMRYALEYTISAKPATPGQWTPRGAGDTWSVSWDDPRTRVYGITIENQDELLTNLHIAQSTLHDTSGHLIGADRLKLLRQASDISTPAISVAPNTAASLVVVIDQGAESGPFGTFDGAIRFAVDGTSTTKDVTVKVQATSTAVKSLGVVFTAAGLLLAWVVTARLRPELSRLQFMRPVAALNEQVVAFRAEIEAASGAIDEANKTIASKDPALPRLKANAGDLETALDRTTLDGLGLLPIFALGVDASAEASTALKAHLDQVSSRLAALMILLRSGVLRLTPLLARGQQQDILDRIRRVDASADTVTNEADARTKAQAEMPPPDAGRESGFALSPERLTTVEGIDFAIRHAVNVTALIWAVLSLAVGTAWILGRVDYGAPIDFISSFLWGFGLTSFGAGIQNLTPASVGTQLNLKLPK
jgi:hypothetical protein